MSRSSQEGMAMVVGLIMLGLMTVMLIASFNIGRTSLEIVGNMQRRNEVVSSANAVIEEALSTTRLFKTPATVFVNPCTSGNTRCFDLNNDGVNDITVSLTPNPTCVQADVLTNGALGNLADPDNLGCASSVPSGGMGIEGAPTQQSMCANSVWEINAVAVDNVTQARVAVTEGAAVRVARDNVASACP